MTADKQDVPATELGDALRAMAEIADRVALAETQGAPKPLITLFRIMLRTSLNVAITLAVAETPGRNRNHDPSLPN